MGCHFLLQWIFLTQGSNSGLLHYRWFFTDWAMSEAWFFNKYIKILFSTMSWIISWFSNQMLTALDPLNVVTFMRQIKRNLKRAFYALLDRWPLYLLLWAGIPQKKWSSHHGQQKSSKCSTWMQSEKRQNDLCSFPRQTIQYHSNLSLCPNQ